MQSLQSKLSQLEQKKTQLKKIITEEQNILEQFKVNTDSLFRLDEYFSDITNENISKSSPWGYQELNRLRETLFLESLKPHKVFVENSERLRDNLDAFSKLLRRMIPTKEAKIPVFPLLKIFSLLFL